MKTGTLITLGLVLVLGISFAFWAIGLSNSEIRLRNRGSAQQESCAAYFDKVWKILQQQAQVADQYKDAFKEIYPLLMEGRYSDDGQGQQTFMKWVTEHNPEFKTELYEKLMASIEGQREGFFIEQQKLIDIDRQHKNMRMTFPNKIIVGRRADLAIVIIKSLKTDDAYKTGQENDVDLFKPKE
jgi:hypothetical protein